jgi:hypothetical protein
MAGLPSLTVEEWIAKHPTLQRRSTPAQVRGLKSASGNIEISYETIYGSMNQVIPMAPRQFGKRNMLEELFRQAVATPETIQRELGISDSGYRAATDDYRDNNGQVICTMEELEMGTISRVQAEGLLAQAAKALEIVNARERKFGEDIYLDGDILYADVKWLTRELSSSESTFKRQRIYKYAFIKAGNVWYSSGPRAGGQQFTWEQLVDWLNSRYIVKFGGTVKQKSRIKKNEVVSDS